MFTLKGNDHDIDVVSFTDGTRLIASCDNGLVRMGTLQARGSRRNSMDSYPFEQQMESTVDGWIGSPNVRHHATQRLHGIADPIGHSERHTFLHGKVNDNEAIQSLRVLG